MVVPMAPPHPAVAVVAPRTRMGRLLRALQDRFQVDW